MKSTDNPANPVVDDKTAPTAQVSPQVPNSAAVTVQINAKNMASAPANPIVDNKAVAASKVSPQAANSSTDAKSQPKMSANPQLILSQHPDPEKKGWFLLRPQMLVNSADDSLHVVLRLDVSGSMQTQQTDWQGVPYGPSRLDILKTAVPYLVADIVSKKPKAVFTVCTFNHEIKEHFKEEKAQAVYDLVPTLEAGGSTDYYGLGEKLAKSINPNNVGRTVVMDFTDGTQCTYEPDDVNWERPILGDHKVFEEKTATMKKAFGGVAPRIFGIGIGLEHADHELRHISEQTGGAYFFAHTPADVGRVVKNLGEFLKFNGAPVQATLALNGHAIKQNDFYPRSQYGTVNFNDPTSVHVLEINPADYKDCKQGSVPYTYEYKVGMGQDQIMGQSAGRLELSKEHKLDPQAVEIHVVHKMGQILNDIKLNTQQKRVAFEKLQKMVPPANLDASYQRLHNALANYIAQHTVHVDHKAQLAMRASHSMHMFASGSRESAASAESASSAPHPIGGPAGGGSGSESSISAARKKPAKISHHLHIAPPNAKAAPAPQKEAHEMTSEEAAAIVISASSTPPKRLLSWLSAAPNPLAASSSVEPAKNAGGSKQTAKLVPVSEEDTTTNTRSRPNPFS